MKARVVKGYPDKITKRFYNKDEIVEFDKDRIKELVEKKILEPYKEPKKNQIELSD